MKKVSLANKFFAAILAAIGLLALVTVFLGATHQIFVTAICAVMVWALLSDKKRDAIDRH